MNHLKEKTTRITGVITFTDSLRLIDELEDVPFRGGSGRLILEKAGTKFVSIGPELERDNHPA